VIIYTKLIQTCQNMTRHTDTGEQHKLETISQPFLHATDDKKYAYLLKESFYNRTPTDKKHSLGTWPQGL